MRTLLIYGSLGVATVAVASLLWYRGSALLNWFVNNFRTAGFYEVLKTFLAEAGVLWLVFPLLDQLAKDRKERDWTWVTISPFIAVFFLILSGIAAKKEEKAKVEE